MSFDPIELFPGCVMRAMTLEDIDGVLAVEKAKPLVGQTSYPKESFISNVGREDVFSFVVTLQGNVVGLGILELRNGEAFWRKVTSNFPGGGLLVHIVKALRSLLPQLGARRILSRCSDDLWPMYQKLGFAFYGTLPNFFGKGKSATAMVLNL